jgi:hypothetical protein
VGQGTGDKALARAGGAGDQNIWQEDKNLIRDLSRPREEQYSQIRPPACPDDHRDRQAGKGSFEK